MKKIDEVELREIFQRIKNDDKDAFELLYKNYHDLIFGIAFSILKNRENSEDVTQDIFAKLININKDKLPTQCEASWLYSVTKNESLQFLRKHKKNIDIDELYSLESESDEIDDIVDMNSYYKLLEGLKPIDKEIISLRVLSDFTFEKISQILNMPLGTVQWRYYKAIHCIKLSISNLAAFVVVFTIWISAEKSSNESQYKNYEEKSDNLYSEVDKSDSSSDDIINFGETDIKNGLSAYDSSGACNSIANKNNYIFIIFSIILLSFTIFFAVKKKIKIKKLKKNQ